MPEYDNTDLDIDAAGLALGKISEGLSLIGYLCPAGVPTIGWGHTGPEVYIGQVITEAEAQRILIEDIQWAERVIERYVTVELNQAQFSATTLFIFNIGEGGFAGSTMLRRLNAGDFRGAADAMLMWVKAKNPETNVLVTLPGLVTRRQNERALFLSGAATPAVIIEEASHQPQPVGPIPQAVSARGNEATPIARTREVLTTVAAGSGAATVVGGFFSQLAPAAQVALIIGVIAIIGAGFYFFILPLLRDRKKGIR